MKAMNGVITFSSKPDLFFKTRNDKFPQEKVNFEDAQYLIHFDGVLLNSEQLKKELGCSDNRTIIAKLYERHGSGLVLHAKGTYSLVLWDKKKQIILVTNDLLSKRSLYYHCSQDTLYYASSYYDLLNKLKNTGFIPKIETSSIQEMIDYGFLIGNKTYLKNVFYLEAFESLLLDLRHNSIKVIHHQPKIFTIPNNEKDIIQQFDILFSSAVDMQFKKNIEYGYRQCLTLSGGMDSRSCLLKAVKLGYSKDILCFNYSQSGSVDYKVSLEIATNLGLDYLFYPMDAAVFIDRLDENMKCNECQQGCIGSTGARTMATTLNTSNLGIINIGICGGELMGDLIFQKETGMLNKMKRRFVFSNTFSSEYFFDKQTLLNHLRGCQNFVYMFIDKCECISPFMDEDVFMFVSQIDPIFLANRSLYKKWMMQYIPNNYITTHLYGSITVSPLNVLFSKISNKIQKRVMGFSEIQMNPIDHWFKMQKKHEKKWNEEFISICDWMKKVHKDSVILTIAQNNWGRTWEKNLCLLTALYAIKNTYDIFDLSE